MNQNVIIVTDVRFWVRVGGSQARINSLVKNIDKKFSKYLFFIGHFSNDDLFQLKKFEFSEIVSVEDVNNLTWKSCFSFLSEKFFYFLRYAEKITYKKFSISPSLSYFYNERAKNAFLNFLEKIKPFAIIVEYVRLSYLVEQKSNLLKDVIKIVDTHDVLYRRYDSYRKRNLKHWLSISRIEEIEALSRFDAILAIQYEDANDFQAMLPGKKILVAGHSVSVKHPFRQKEYQEKVGYIGGNNNANIDAFNWFVDNCWSKIRESRPGLKLVIGGAIALSNELHITNDMEMVGPLSSVDGFYDRIDIAVNPVQAGGGLKIKNIEALAHGVPLVTTPVGSQGFPGNGERPFKVCADPLDFANAVIEISRDAVLRQAMSNSGYEYANRYFSHEAAYKELNRYLFDGLSVSNDK